MPVEDLTAVQRYNKHRAPIYFIGSEDQFGDVPDFDSEAFVQWVKDEQSKLGLKVDGYFGPKTVKAISEDLASPDDRVCTSQPGEFDLPIGLANVRHTGIPTITYRQDHRMGEMANRVRTKPVKHIVLHYDVTFNSSDAIEILKRRDLSTHFCIDGDEHGTILQLMNPATHIAYHEERVNATSVGIDLNNPVLPKYAERDAENRGRERGIVETELRGETLRHLDFFNEQVRSLAHLLVELCDLFDIEPNYPDDDTVLDDDELEHFEGVLAHYHLDGDKIDPVPLRFDELFNTEPLKQFRENYHE